MVTNLSLLLLFGMGQAEFDLANDPRFVLSFAQQLEREGDCFAAISEYKRYMYLEGEEIDSILYRIARIYQTVGRYGNALDTVERIKDRNGRYRFERGRVYFGAGDYQGARDSWCTLAKDTLVGLTFLREGNFPKANQFIGPIGTPDRKSALVAGILSSVVPGSGRAYCGRLGDGLFSLLVTVGSGLIAYHYYDSDRTAPAVGFTALSLFLYLGEIYGSTNSCMIYNEKKAEDFTRWVESEIGVEHILEGEW